MLLVMNEIRSGAQTYRTPRVKKLVRYHSAYLRQQAGIGRASSAERASRPSGEAGMRKTGKWRGAAPLPTVCGVSPSPGLGPPVRRLRFLAFGLGQEHLIQALHDLRRQYRLPLLKAQLLPDRVRPCLLTSAASNRLVSQERSAEDADLGPPS